MVKKIKGIKIELIIISIVLFALGFFLVIYPELSQLIICKAVGIALCVWGVLRLITYFSMAKEEPEVIAMFFGTILAIVIIIDGILKLQYGIEFYHMKADKWWIEAVVAAFMVVMGVIALFNPFDSSVALMIFIGIVLMVEGVSDLISIIRISAFVKKLKDM